MTEWGGRKINGTIRVGIKKDIPRKSHRESVNFWVGYSALSPPPQTYASSCKGPELSSFMCSITAAPLPRLVIGQRGAPARNPGGQWLCILPHLQPGHVTPATPQSLLDVSMLPYVFLSRGC